MKIRTAKEILKENTGVDLSKYTRYQNVVTDKHEFTLMIKQAQKEAIEATLKAVETKCTIRTEPSSSSPIKFAQDVFFVIKPNRFNSCKDELFKQIEGGE
jgi:hypothetical protein